MSLTLTGPSSRGHSWAHCSPWCSALKQSQEPEFKGYTGIVAQMHHLILTKRTCEDDTWETGTMANHLPQASH